MLTGLFSVQWLDIIVSYQRPKEFFSRKMIHATYLYDKGLIYLTKILQAMLAIA